MIRISELRHKDVIETNAGKRLGYINDVEIDTAHGCVQSLILPRENRFFSLFTKGDETILTWAQIKKIGIDVILVQKEAVMPTGQPEEVPEQEDIFSVPPAKKKTVDDDFDFFSF